MSGGITDHAAHGIASELADDIAEIIVRRVEEVTGVVCEGDEYLDFVGEVDAGILESLLWLGARRGD